MQADGTCSVEGCGRPQYTKAGRCCAHYQRQRKHGDPRSDRPIRDKPKHRQTCSVVGCSTFCHAYGRCSLHHYRWKTHGDPLWEPPQRPTVCVVEGCGRPSGSKTGRGMCSAHGQRWQKHRDVQADVPIVPRYPAVCGVPDCRRPHSGRGWCRTHLARFERHGHPQADMPIRQGPKPKLREDGYVDLFVPGRGDVRVHRLETERRLGRRLLPTEQVHHVNGVRHDNRPENLELWSTSHPSGQRVTDKVQWAKEILALYEKDVEEGRIQ